MGLFGNILGQGLGGLAGVLLGADPNKTAGLGGQVGDLLPFKKGGRVPGKKGKPRMILAHGGEYVLANGIKPTKAQIKATAKLHNKKKGKK
jgi:hypothetical protein